MLLQASHLAPVSSNNSDFSGMESSGNEGLN